VNREQQQKLRDSLKFIAVVTVAGLAARVGVTEDAIEAVVTDLRLPTFRKAGTLWVRGQQPHRAKPSTDQLHREGSNA
jgi:hypothetical protein